MSNVRIRELDGEVCAGSSLWVVLKKSKELNAYAKSVDPEIVLEDDVKYGSNLIVHVEHDGALFKYTLYTSFGEWRLGSKSGFDPEESCEISYANDEVLEEIYKYFEENF